MRASVVAGVLAASVSLTGCDWVTGSSACDGPFPEAVDPDRTALVGDSASDSLVVADIYFARDTATLRPTSTQLERVRAHGGDIRRVFHVEAVRAEIPLDGLWALERDPAAEMLVAVTVPDPSLHTVSLFVSHDESVSIGHYFESLGGIVRHRYSTLSIIGGYLDNAAIPCLRSYEYVEYVEHTMDRINLPTPLPPVP